MGNENKRGNVLSYIFEEAEDLLTFPYKFKSLISWDSGLPPTKYDKTEKDFLRTSNVWLYVVMCLFFSLIFLGLIIVALWFSPSYLFLFTYYLGILISLVFTIVYITSRKLLRKYLALKRYFYVNNIIFGGITILLLILQLIWSLPHAIFPVYFFFFFFVFMFTVMLVYLMKRPKQA